MTKKFSRLAFALILVGLGVLRIAGPLQVDATIEASGIDFDGTRHLVFFSEDMSEHGRHTRISALMVPNSL